MKFNPISRRMFLQGMGAMLPIPFLESLLPRQAWAQTSSVPLRYFTIFNKYEYGWHPHWLPSTAKPGNVLNVTGHQPIYYQTLSSYMNDGRVQLSRMIGPAFEAYLSSMNIYRSLDCMAQFGHGFGHLLGNCRSATNEPPSCPSKITIDQLLARNVKFNPGGKEPFIAGNSPHPFYWGYDSAQSIIQKRPVASTPLQAFNILFNNGTLPESGTTTAAHPRKDVLSRVLEDFNRVKNGRQISSLDKTILTNFTDQMSTLLNGLQSQTGQSGVCSYKNAATGGSGLRFDNKTTYNNFANIMVAAAMCDVRRVFSMAADLEDVYYDTHPSSDFHQGISHDPMAVINGKVNHQYMAEIQAQLLTNYVAPLIAGLSQATDVNGKSILYNSIVHYGLEHATVHNSNAVPTLLAGNAGGALKTGYFMDYSNYALGSNPQSDLDPYAGFSNNPTAPNFTHEYHGLPYNRLFVTILQAFGLTPAEYEDSSANSFLTNRSDSLYGSQNNGIANVGGYGWAHHPVKLDGNSAPKPRWRFHNFHYYKFPLPMP